MTEQSIEFFEEDHRYEVDGRVWPSVTQIIGTAIPSRFSKVAPEVLEAARQRGRRIHAACHYLDEDDLDWATVLDEDRPYVESYSLFKEATDFKPEKIESIVVNQELGYAGRLDRFGTLLNRKAMIDLKTGVCGKETGFQLAGYALPIDEVCDRYALQLKPWKMAKLIYYGDPLDFPRFKQCVRLLHEDDASVIAKIVRDLAGAVGMDAQKVWQHAMAGVGKRYHLNGD